MKEQVLSILQMRELQELGIDVFKASMYWWIPNIEYPGNIKLCLGQVSVNYEKQGDDVVPTFTLQDILEMLPKNIIHSNKQLKTCNYKLCTFDNKVMYTFNSFDQCWLKCTYGKNLLEAAFYMLKWCKQNNYI